MQGHEQRMLLTPTNENLPIEKLCNFTKIIIIFLNTCVLRQCCQLPFKAENTDNCLSDNTEILIMPRWQCPRVLLAFEMSWC